MRESATDLRARSRPRAYATGALVLIPLLLLLGIHFFPPIPQDPAYHNLVDGRTLLGVPNFVNVVSNLPFLIFGVMGLALARRRAIGAAWTVFFAGVALVSVASAYYHAAPNNATLIWDRLPITVAFMGLFVAVVSEHLDPALGRRLLLPAIAVGIGSLLWWYYADDLRFYVWVQAAPLLTVLLALALFPARYTHRAYLLYGLGFYLLAKVTEFTDGAIYTATGELLSGHSIKHVLASLSALCVYLMLRRRQPSTPAS